MREDRCLDIKLRRRDTGKMKGYINTNKKRRKEQEKEVSKKIKKEGHEKETGQKRKEERRVHAG